MNAPPIMEAVSISAAIPLDHISVLVITDLFFTKTVTIVSKAIAQIPLQHPQVSGSPKMTNYFSFLLQSSVLTLINCTLSLYITKLFFNFVQPNRHLFLAQFSRALSAQQGMRLDILYNCRPSNQVNI